METANSEPVSVVEIEGVGVAGTSGRPAGQIDRPTFPGLFDTAIWISSPSREVDLHVEFQGTFETAGESVRLRVQAPSEFRVEIDSSLICVGPLRFSPSVPEFSTHWVDLEAGEHAISIQVHGEGIQTRIAAKLPNFLYCELFESEDAVEIGWRAREMEEYEATGLRVSPLQGWLEWQAQSTESALRKAHWKAIDIVGAKLVDLGSPVEALLNLASPPEIPLLPVSSGEYRDTFTGYERDDLASQFLLADDKPTVEQDVDGTWTRYDLGRIRVGSLELDVKSAGSAEITLAYAEKLTPDGRPAPVVALSLGPTRMIQHFKTDPGTTRIVPLQSLGARYLEVRAKSSAPVTLSNASFRSRESLTEPTGSFQSGDSLLNEIWSVGMDTLRSSAEDSLVDSVRERGEWVGDVVSSALELLHAGWGDVRLVRRALFHSAASANKDGLVAGCGPGSLIYLGTYACQWITACVEVATAEGSLDILRELNEPARANVEAIVRLVHDDGSHALPWNFVDWGYTTPADGPDLAVITHAILGLQSWRLWQNLLGIPVSVHVTEKLDRLAHLVGAGAAHSISYHALTLASIAGLVSPGFAADGVLAHLELGFPFNREGKRLRDPTQASQAVVTPYFTNYSIPLLLERGMGVKVLDLWKRGWGWMLEHGATTWWEVFDDRWSQCHYWSGSPTWQMSKHVLGVRSALSAAGTTPTLRVNSLGLTSAQGRVFIPTIGFVDARWTRTDEELIWEVDADSDFLVITESGTQRLRAGGDRVVLQRAVGDLYI